MKFYRVEDFLKLDFGESSEERLERIPPESRRPQFFREKATELKREAHIETQLITDADKMPKLSPDAQHKYRYCFEDAQQRLTNGENLLIGVAKKGSRVIGFVIVALREDETAEIEILDVSSASQRSSGLRTSFELSGEDFTVGVAHILVDLILAELDCAIHADATTSSSRYVCKSLGFDREPSSTNPCRLQKARGV